MLDRGQMRSRRGRYLVGGLLMAVIFLTSACSGSPSPDSPEPSPTPAQIEPLSAHHQETQYPPPNLRFERIGIEDGLSHSAVWKILQDSEGYMWFGTQDGLNKYDGYKFKIFKNDPTDRTSLSENFIFSICIC